MDQASQILAHMKAGKPITQLDAFKLFRCFRLSGRIYDLRKAGHEISATMVEKNGKWLAEYRLPSQRGSLTARPFIEGR